jgi:hypothetical protein
MQALPDVLSSGRWVLQFRLGFRQEGPLRLWFGEFSASILLLGVGHSGQDVLGENGPVPRLSRDRYILEQALSCPTVRPGLPYGAHGDICEH